jgi:hypothetical protein
MKPKNSTDYQSVLRAIGQGVEKLGVESVDLEFTDNYEFVVSGICKETPRAPTPKPRVKTSFLSLIINAAKNNAKQKTGAVLFHFTGIRFTQNNIDLLDRAGKASRSRLDGNPQNPLGIAHVLRMAGAYLDHKGSRFSRLFWHHGRLTLWHINENGGEAKEIFTPENLYDNWIHHFKARKPYRALKPTGSD